MLLALDIAVAAVMLKALQTSLWWHFCPFKVDISVVKWYDLSDF